MDTFRSITEIYTNPWLVLVLALNSYIISTFLTGLLTFILAPAFGFKAKEYRIFGNTFERKNDGKWEYRGNKHNIGFTVDCILDVDKIDGVNNDSLEKKEIGFLMTTGLIALLISGILAVAGVFGGLNIRSDFLASLVYWSAIALLVFVIVRFVVRIYVLVKVNSKNSLGGYVQAALGKIRMGIPMDQLDLKPVTDLSFKKVIRAEKIMYFPIYFAYLDASRQYDRMAAAVGDIENELRPTTNSRVDIAAAGTLVYYYSYHYIEPSKAKEYYHRTGDSLEKDTDANAMRIKGFYNLNCFGDVENATRCLYGAKNAIDSFSMGSERDYERTCIAKLEDAINRFRAQNQ